MNPSQKRFPPELKERAVRMARDAIAEQGGESFGVVTRIARQLGPPLAFVPTQPGERRRGSLDTGGEPERFGQIIEVAGGGWRSPAARSRSRALPSGRGECDRGSPARSTSRE